MDDDPSAVGAAPFASYYGGQSWWAAPARLRKSIEQVRVGGHISLVGVLTGLQGEVSTVALLAKQGAPARTHGRHQASGVHFSKVALEWWARVWPPTF